MASDPARDRRHPCRRSTTARSSATENATASRARSNPPHERSNEPAPTPSRRSQAPRPPPRGVPGPPLLAADRGRLPRLVPAVHPVPPRPPPGDDGRAGGERLPHPLGRRRPGVRVHPEPSLVCPPVPLRRRPRPSAQPADRRPGQSLPEAGSECRAAESGNSVALPPAGADNRARL